MGLHNCIGLHNLRHFVQLLFASLLGSAQTLTCLFLARNRPIFYQSIGGPWIFIAFQACVHMFCIGYLGFLWQITQSDLTSIDLFQQNDKLEYSRIASLSLPAKVY